jgi:hypothetical protein
VRVWTALTLTVFLLLGPPVGLATFLAASKVGAPWNDDAAIVLLVARKLLIFRPGAIVFLTYLMGAPAASLAGIVVARLRRRRRDHEALRVALAGLAAGGALVLICAVTSWTGVLRMVALFAAAQVIAACIVATVACWLISVVLTRLIEPLAGPDCLLP